jgi:multicomponent Na+:H+ antiporter subunit E
MISGGVLARAIVFFAFWLTLYGADRTALPVGAATAAAATWISLRLLPPGTSRPSPLKLARLALRFLRNSAIAGIDVARRAFDPALPLQPGFVTVPLRLAPSPSRSAFRTVMSLLPGSMPCGADESREMLVHCLDLRDAVAAQMQEEESLFIQAFGLREHV